MKPINFNWVLGAIFLLPGWHLHFSRIGDGNTHAMNPLSSMPLGSRYVSETLSLRASRCSPTRAIDQGKCVVQPRRSISVSIYHMEVMYVTLRCTRHHLPPFLSEPNYRPRTVLRQQGLHFFFSAGASVAPAAVGQLGCRQVFLAFGLLAIPASLACCLANDGGEDRDSGWPLLHESGDSILREESDGTVISIDATTTGDDDIDMMEGKTCAHMFKTGDAVGSFERRGLLS